MTTSPAGQSIASSDFWSGTAGSARWEVELRDRRFVSCSTQAMSFFKAVRRAVYGSRFRETSASIAWTGELSTAVRNYAIRRLGMAPGDVDVAEGQTLWTPEMLRFLLWFAYYRGQVSTVSKDAIVLPPGTTLPRSNTPAPDDHSGLTVVMPTCTEVSTVAPPVTDPTLYAPQPTPLAANLDFETSNFWSGEANSARWQVISGDRLYECATQGKTFLRALKARLQWPLPADPRDDGTWTQSWTDQLYRFARNDLEVPAGDIPFLPGHVSERAIWTRPMLQFALWVAYYSGPPWNIRTYTAIRLPQNTGLPRPDLQPPPDGSGVAGVAPPACRLAVLPLGSAASSIGGAIGNPDAPGATQRPGSWIPGIPSGASLGKLLIVSVAFAGLGYVLGRRY